MTDTKRITLPDDERAALIAALARHRLTVTESEDTGGSIIIYPIGHPHITSIAYWRDAPPEDRWGAEWMVCNPYFWHRSAGEGPTPAAAIEALLAEIAALAQDPAP